MNTFSSSISDKTILIAAPSRPPPFSSPFGERHSTRPEARLIYRENLTSTVVFCVVEAMHRVLSDEIGLQLRPPFRFLIYSVYILSGVENGMLLKVNGCGS